MALTLEPAPKNPLLARLLQQGLSSEPVQHWTQGASRIAHALLGGLEAKEEKANETTQAHTLAALLGGQQMPPAGGQPPAMPQAAPQMAPPPRPPASMPPQNVSGPVPPNDPTMSIPPQQVQMANAPQQPPAPPAPPPQQPLPATSSAAPPAMQAQVAALLRDPDPVKQRLGRQLATQILAKQMQPPKYEKLDEATLYDQNTGNTRSVGGERRPITDPAERARFGIPPDDNRPYQLGPDNRLINPPPETRVNMSTVADPILSGVGDQIVKAREAARDVPVRIQAIHEARSALDKGATTGALADWRLQAQKVFGIAPEDVQNTEVFRASVGREVLGQIKALGANPSNTDRDYIEKVAGGQITLDEKSLRRILDMQEKYARQTLRTFNREAKSVMDANPNAYRSIQGIMNFEEPPEYAPPAPASRSSPTQSRPKQGKTKSGIGWSVD